MNCLKSFEFVLNIFFVFKNFSKNFREYIRTEKPSYTKEIIFRKFFKSMRKSQFLKVKNSLIELEKDFIESKDREVIKREIEELFFKPIMVSIDDMDKFEQKEMNKTRTIKNT